ncbi:1,4-dihydroxy-6-naphthoate synthase [Paucidesulfovibrio longus]|uniref:1,4-dihydroxy-6-naphthoate synthase n=1 Tax=Paucidesulfovibrio longus TaxID=889 RepID=UPI0003B5926D|nr:1,4-dihydroxy-6-naphthoate synthase [Paucidesulfovibrio longus]
MPAQLSIGISPCPNDTFIFGGLALGLIGCEAGDLDFRLGDVEELNNWAAGNGPDVCKVSVAAAAGLLDEYVLLRAGGALGWGVGPILAGVPGTRLDGLRGKVAVPGMRTTATLLFSMLADEHGLDVSLEEMVYNEIMPSVSQGRCQAGLVIHEGRFVLGEYGLECLQDMGEWWEKRTGLPLPLGCIVARRSLGEARLRLLDKCIRASILLARNQLDAVWPFIVRHAQEMDPGVIREHIDTFVTDYSLDVGQEGEGAVATLLREAAKLSGARLPEGNLLLGA